LIEVELIARSLIGQLRCRIAFTAPVHAEILR
jgi:hypothetical protein